MGRRGMTLMELVVVLAILTMLAGVAVRGLGDLGMHGRVEATRRVLDGIRDGVLGGGVGGEPGAGGFLADMGRLPRTAGWVGTDGREWIGARELSEGTGFLGHGLYPAVGSNVVARFVGTWDATNADVVASGLVGVMAGWRGPYVLGRGEGGLPMDGWGRLMAGRGAGDVGGPCWMLSWQTNGVAGTTWVPGPAGHGVAGVGGMEISGMACDIGGDGGGVAAREWVSWERRDVWADPVVVQVRDGAGRWAGGGTLLVMWYGPNPEVVAEGRPVQAVVVQASVGGGAGVMGVAMSGWAAPTLGPRVFRACLKAGGQVHDTGPLHVKVGRGTSVVELSLP